jgi:predicted ATPase with chaperone activity
LRARVEAARQIQRERFACEDHKAGAISNTVTCNADMRVAEIRKYCAQDETGRSLMNTAIRAHAKYAMQFGPSLPPHLEAFPYNCGFSGE